MVKIKAQFKLQQSMMTFLFLDFIVQGQQSSKMRYYSIVMAVIETYISTGIYFKLGQKKEFNATVKHCIKYP